ncbi:MAG TPA: hypothetical protein VHQ21_03280, partial [Rhodanobacteraceae bacterium]|nr:hypothetical protein [Rhodanobacteraceae bacterium]
GLSRECPAIFGCSRASPRCDGPRYYYAVRGNRRSTRTFELIMKLPIVKNLACLIMLLATHSASAASAACAIDDPAAVAKAFYSKHANFSSEDPARIRKIITPRLFDALNQEYKCAQGQICALEADPWTDAQDGRIGKPVEFATASNSGVEATVSMTYPFILGKTPSQKRLTLLLQRESPAACWLLGDLVGPRGESLVRAIEEWYKEYGSAL